SIEIESAKIDIRQHFGATVARGALQLARHCAHPTDRHLPFPGLVADDMVEKTAVLHQRRIVRMCQDADLSVGKYEATHQIVLQIPLDRQAERLLCQTTPRF